jgi:hypothetical protein
VRYPGQLLANGSDSICVDIPGALIAHLKLHQGVDRRTWKYVQRGVSGNVIEPVRQVLNIHRYAVALLIAVRGAKYITCRGVQTGISGQDDVVRGIDVAIASRLNASSKTQSSKCAPLDLVHRPNACAGKPWASHPDFVRAVLGGWAVNGILTLESGFPTDIRTPNSSSGRLFTTYNLPNAVSGVSMYLPNKGVNGWFNPAAFTEPGTVLNAVGQPITLFGDLARRAGRGPGTRNLDFSVFRNFNFTEHVRLQFRAEAFNISNTPAFFLPAANSPELTIGNSSFGLLAASAAVARQVQFGMKLYF